MSGVNTDGSVIINKRKNGTGIIRGVYIRICIRQIPLDG